MNDQYVKVAKLLSGLVWHAHDAEDEMFLVVSGRLRIQFPDDMEVPELKAPMLGASMRRAVVSQHCPVADRHSGGISTGQRSAKPGKPLSF